jgi:hypothetical protein
MNGNVKPLLINQEGAFFIAWKSIGIFVSAGKEEKN